MRIMLSTGTPAELAEPEHRDAATRGLVLFPDIMGLRPLFDDHCELLAREQGWVVVAPEPFPGSETLTVDERLAAMTTMDDERFRADALAAADATGCECVVVTGFCMGGMLTFKAAASGRFHRAAGFYGMIRLPEAWRGSMQEPIDALRSPDRCPTLAIIGTADHFTPEADVVEAEEAGVMVIRYVDAEHGFVHDASRPAHRADDSADAWRIVTDFLRT